MNPKITTIAEEKAVEFIQAVVGKKVTHIWRGYGTAIFIEVGVLTKDDSENNPSGEFTIAIEGTWRLEEKDKVIYGADNDDVTLTKSIKCLEDLEVTNIKFFGRLKEIEIEFDNSIYLSSFAMNSGELEWSVRSNKTWLYYKSNEFVFEVSKT